MKKVRLAILGQGRSGYSIHGTYLKSGLLDKYEIAAVSDPVEGRRAMAAREFGCDTYADYQDIMKRDDLDLVVNALPSQFHAPVTLELLNRGFNVLCEKPLARTAREVDQLIEASERQGGVLAIFQQSRYAPAFQQVRKVLASGVLGRLVQASIAYSGFARRWDWQTLRENHGGNLLNTGPHPVDQALQLFGTDAMPEITCLMDRVNTSGDAEDYVKLLMYGKGRPVIDVEISSCNAYPSFTYHLQGSQGSLVGSTTHLDWKYYDPSEAPAREVVRETLKGSNQEPIYCREELPWREDSWDIADEDKDIFRTMTIQYYTMLHRTLTTGAPLEITPAEVRQQIAVMEECHRQNEWK